MSTDNNKQTTPVTTFPHDPHGPYGSTRAWMESQDLSSIRAALAALAVQISRYDAYERWPDPESGADEESPAGRAYEIASAARLFADFADVVAQRYASTTPAR